EMNNQGELFDGLDLFNVIEPAKQNYELVFQLYKIDEKKLQIRPANHHILEDGSSGHLVPYSYSELTSPPSPEQQGLIETVQRGMEDLPKLLERFLNQQISLLWGQMGSLLEIVEAPELSLSFKLHSYLPSKGILFIPHLHMASTQDIRLQGNMSDLFQTPLGMVLFDEKNLRIGYLKDCSQEQKFLRMLGSKSRGMLDKDLQGMEALRQRLKAEKIHLDYSLVDTRIREYPPCLVLQLQNRQDKLKIHFIFHYEGSPVAAQDLRDYFPASEQGRGVLYKRNRKSENELIHGATTLLDSEIQYQRGHYASLVDATKGEDLQLRLELQDFLNYYAGDLMAQGIELELEKHPIKGKQALSFQIQSNHDWLELQARQEDQSVELDELFESHGLAKVGLNYQILSKEDVQLLQSLRRQGLNNSGELETSASNLPLLETMESQLDENDPLKQRLSDLRELNHFQEDPSQPPELHGFAATLRNYQAHGLQWLRFLHNKGLQGCLADDMGLGKTVQTLALIHHLKSKNQWKTSLLIGPVVTLGNWEAEIKRFSPEITFIRHQGAQRSRHPEDLLNYDLIISSYQTIRNDLELFENFEFFYIILDEAHYIKNARSQTFQAIHSLKSHHRLSLTGTPIENSTVELWSQMSFLNPGLLGSLRDFQYRFALPIEREGDEKAAQLLRNRVYPFILRRTKEEVATDLPPREEIVLTLEMTDEQQMVYQRMKDFYRAQVKGLLDSQGRQKSSMQIFSYLLKMRQLAIHPPMAGEEYQDVSSCKMDALTDLLDEISMEDHKVLVFSQFLGSLEAIRKICESRHWNYSYLTGSTPDREEQIRLFQENPNTKIFLLSLKAGGIGINLTQADYVVLFDPWWNPAVERQAIDRAYRIGQKRKVFTYRLIAKNTIEEKIRIMQENKQNLADSIITEDEGLYKDLSDQDIMNLFE
nr:DEAD/DEAH box helicase [Spirochaetaceae bacterium]